MHLLGWLCFAAGCFFSCARWLWNLCSCCGWSAGHLHGTRRSPWGHHSGSCSSSLQHYPYRKQQAIQLHEVFQPIVGNYYDWAAIGLWTRQTTQGNGGARRRILAKKLTARHFIDRRAARVRGKSARVPFARLGDLVGERPAPQEQERKGKGTRGSRTTHVAAPFATAAWLLAPWNYRADLSISGQYTSVRQSDGSGCCAGSVTYAPMNQEFTPFSRWRSHVPGLVLVPRITRSPSG